MTEFLRRLDAYSQGPQDGNKSPSYEGFFDNILRVRRYGRQDRTGALLAGLMDQTDSSAESQITVDVEIWHAGDQETADGWVDSISTALSRFGAEVHDSFSSASAGVSLLRVTAAVNLISQLLDVDLVAKIEALPVSGTEHVSPSDVSAEQLADLPVPDSEAPIIGLIDSGVQLEHPLLRGCVVDATFVSSYISDGIDRHGHGTAVASVLLRGSIESQLASGDWEVPPCRILSVRVLDGENRIPPYRLPQSEISNAVAYLSAQGVKVINLSLGDVNGVMVGSRAPTIAAVLDSLARKFGVIFVVPTGNVIPAEYSGAIDGEFREDYPLRMLDSADSGLIDPAPSATSITVGGTVPPPRPAALGTVPLGKPGWPSPFSRIGPGIDGAIKPEVSAPAGTLGQGIDDGNLQDFDAYKIAVADGRPGASGFVAYDYGTSLAAPHVARACAMVQGEYPEASSNLIRALVLQSVSEKDSPLKNVQGMTAGAREIKSLLLGGFGEVSEERSRSSGDWDTVLFAEEEIPLDAVHLYTVPIPESFFASGRISRGISISLCYDPPVRARRMDYMASRMQFELLRGVTPERTIDLLLAEEKVARQTRKQRGERLPTLSSLPGSQRIAMKPSRTVRSTGANQLGRFVWRSALQRFNDNSSDFVLAVQNLNRWDSPTRKQPYAVAIRLWVGENLPPIYADVRSKIRAMRAQAIARSQART